MRGHQIRHEVLVEVHFGVQLFIPLGKAAVHAVLWLAHHAQNAVGDVLGRHLELPAHVVPDELAEKRLIFVVDQVIEPNAGAHEHALDLRQCAQLSQQGDVIAVVDLEVRARLREKALALWQAPCCNCFLQAGWRKFAVGPPTSWM